MERLPRRRRRPALSCTECRRRKIRFYREPRENTRTAQQPLSPSTEGLSPVSRFPQSTPTGQIDDTLSIQVPSVPTTEQLGTSRLSTNGRNDENTPISSHNEEPRLRDLLLRVQKLENSSASNPLRGLSETGRTILARQSGLQNSQVILNKTRILRWSHWMGTAPEFEPIYTFYNAATNNDQAALIQDPYLQAEITQAGQLLQKCKDAAKVIKTRRLDPSHPEPARPPITREVADVMVSHYLQTFEITYRVFHIPSFWIEYQRYWNDPENSPPSLRLKMLLVIGIGSSIYEHDDVPSSLRDTVCQWIHDAQTWLSGPLKKDRLDLSGLQLYCLTILARQIFSLGGDLAWISVGSLVHRAMQVGLHRDPKHLPPMSLLQAELRRRLWATILEMAVQSSLDTAMPPRISFDEFDTEVPLNINDDELDETSTTIQPHPRTTYTQMSMQLILLDSLPTRLRILQLLSGLHSELSYVDALALSTKVSDACRAYNRFLKDNEHSTSLFHRNLLEYLVRRFMIPLHCPFASQAHVNPLFHYSLKVSLETSMAIISPEPDDRFARLMSINSGLFREGLRYAFTTITFELIQQTESQRMDGTLGRSSQHRDSLKQVVREVMDLSLERIRQGETNIKGHMFLNMILALVEAKEEDVPHEFKVAQRARESLELCFDLLQPQVGAPLDLASGQMSFMPTSLDEQGGSVLDFDLDFFLSDTDFS
ncbi:hypothetical protein BHE90_002422 [Fusarium euwallaceae]|uniref:Xylanolytic transcriptional activator regulatory domain-containing protein n=1 Tax=Fusarium euwallaceae TaxID=1147111 RepID=A0A430M4Z4_9HYPO|nr:hypothetical protein BHE90_002422 [Fusarium euwallaceae]